LWKCCKRINGEKKVVYCTNCGTKNDDDATVCVKCGQPLKGSQPMKQYRRRKEDECFGLPHGGAIVGLIIGIIIILWGISSIADIDFGSYFWPFIIIIFGILIVGGAIYKFSRRP
jgi:uncharacterized integral membrane protein